MLPRGKLHRAAEKRKARDFLERKVFSRSHSGSIELARENYAGACAGNGISVLLPVLLYPL